MRFLRLLALSLIVAGAFTWAMDVEAQEDRSLNSSLISSLDAALDRSLLTLPAHLDVEDLPLEQALTALQRGSGVHFSYSPLILPDDHRVTCACRHVTVESAVKTLLEATNLEYVVLGDHLVIRERERPSLSTRLAAWTELARDGGRVLQASQSANLINRRVAPLSRQGTIRGEVVDVRSLQPLSAVQVFIPELEIGTVSDGSGQFVISDVPAGAHELQAQRLGYESASQEVNVQAGETTEVRIEMASAALALDEVVVTGTAGQARRREVGTSVSGISLADRPEVIGTVDQALHGETPGLLATRSTGAAGSGAQLRLRGNASLSMGNQPLIYIDGVRIRENNYEVNHAAGQHRAFGANDAIGPLNDINPSDIERIEVVRGPAATALYGTEAAGGVIQIFTKRGASGDAQWDLSIDQGVNWVQPYGPSHEPYMRMDPWLRNGHQQRYQGSVSGGGDQLTYYMSASYDHNEGAMPDDHEEKFLLRLNMGFEPLPDLGLDVNVTRTQQWIQNTTTGGNPYSLPLNVYRSPAGRPANYVGSSEFEPLNALRDHEIVTDANRWVTGLTATYTPTGRLTNRLTLGVDRISTDMRNTRPFGYIIHTQGSTSNIQWTNQTVSVDYVGTYDWNLTSDLRNSFSWGGQTITEEEVNLQGTGDGLPGPGNHTVSAGSTLIAIEDRFRVINAGFFFQNLFDFRDRYFLTLALRIDGNSAFGSGFGLQPYPRASVSYVVSDEDYWPDTWGSLRLRSAYGQAGRAPGAFDAVRTWTPVPWVDGTAFSPRNMGNPDLGPERTDELELGFEWSGFNDRFTVDFTHYNQQTRDALLPVTQTPSDGFGGTQLENVGVISNRGLELSLDANVLQRAELSWDLGFSVSTNRSKLEDMGGASPFSAAGRAWIQEGYPVPSIRGPRVLNPDEFAEPEIDPNYIFGPNQPTHTLLGRTSITLPRGVFLSARGEYQGGHYISDGAMDDGARRGATHPPCDLIYPTLMVEGNREPFAAWERWECDPTHPVETFLIYPADFFRLRDVTLQAPVPFAIPGATRATVTLSLQNAVTWKNSDFRAMDPEMGSQNTSQDQLARRIAQHVPAPASFRASLRITY